MKRLLLALFFLSPTLSAQEYQTTLYPGDPYRYDGFGNAMDIDGDVAILGASDKQENGNNYAGAAYIFRKIGGVWTQEAKLNAPMPEIHDNFGTSVAIEGDVAVVGAPDYAYSSFSGTGRAWVFRRVAGVWTLEQELVPTGAYWDNSCGGTVDISASRIVVNNRKRQTVSVFEQVAGTWTEVTTITAPIGTYYFGASVVLQGDRMAITAPWQTVNGLQLAGVVYIYERSGSAWNQVQAVTESIPSDENYFGSTIAMDGDVLMVGIPIDDYENVTWAGTIEIFRRVAGSFQFEVSLNPSNPTYLAHFGDRIAVEGNRILTASTYDGASGTAYGGAAYLYEWDGVDWIGGQPFHPVPIQPHHGFGVTCMLQGDEAFVSTWEDYAGWSSVGGMQVWDLSQGMRLGLNDPRPEAGNSATWSVVRGTPNQMTWLAYSLAGPGTTPIAPLGVSLDLAAPTQAGPSLVSDAQGATSWNLFLSMAAQGFTVWFQALQAGQTSNYFGAQIR